MLKLALGIFAVVAVALAADSVGGLLKKLFFKRKGCFDDPVLNEIGSIAIGLVFISYFLFFLVTVRWVYREVFWAVLVICILAALPRLKILSGIIHRFFREFRFRKDGWVISLGIYFAFMIVLTTLPPSVRDELIYHLEIPKRLIESKGSVLFTNNIYAYFPNLADNFFLLGLGTAGEAAAKLFHVLSGFLLMLVIFRVSSRWMDKRRAILTVVLFLSVPSVMAIMSLAYVDLMYIFYAVLFFLALLEFFDKREIHHVFFAGLFLGATVCIKYTGLQLSALGLCFVLFAKLKKKDLPVIKPILILGTLSVALALPFFIRNWIVTGWPLFPFALPGFHLRQGFNWDLARANLYLSWLQNFGNPLVASPLWNIVIAPVAVFIIGQFNKPQFYEGILGPVFLLVPVLLYRYRKKLKTNMSLIAFFSLIFLFYWAVTTKQIRFLLPIVPFLCLLVSYGLQLSKKKWVTLAIWFLVLLNVSLGLNEIFKKKPLMYWSGKWTKEQYLAKQNRVYPAYQMANGLLKNGDILYLIHMKNYGYDLDFPWDGDFIFERYRIENLLDRNPSVEEIVRYFDQLNITHVMINLEGISDPVTGLGEDAKKLFFSFLRERSTLVGQHETYGIFQLNE